MPKPPRLKLTDKHRVFIVQELACFAAPREVADLVKSRFDVDITPQAVEHYDPDKVAGKGLAQRWCDLFNVTREAFLKDADKYIPLANKSVRLRKLSKAAAQYEYSGNYVAMADMLERIAKELGNVHSNRRELTGKGGGPIKYQDVEEMTDDEIDAELRRNGIDPDVHPDHPTTQ